MFNRDFLLLWQGQAVSALGTATFSVVMLFWLLEATGSAAVMGLLMSVSSLPSVLLGPLGGVVADRVDRRRLLVAGDAVLGLATLSLAIPLYLAPEHVDLAVIWLFAVSTANGVVMAFFRPAVMSMIPDLVPARELDRANAANQAAIAASQIVGQALGGLLFRLLGAPLIAVWNGVTFLLSAGSEALIRLPPRASTSDEAAAPPSVRRELVEGLRYAAATRGFLPLFALFALLNFLAMPLVIVLPILVRDLLGLSADWYGFALAGLGAGSLAGFAAVGALGLDGRRRYVAVLASLALLSVGMLAMPRIWSGPSLLGVMLGIGVAIAPLNVSVMTLVQATTPEALRGRVTSLVGTLTGAVAPLSMAISGLLIDALDRDVTTFLTVSGSLLLATTAAVGALPSVRHFVSTPTRRPDRGRS